MTTAVTVPVEDAPPAPAPRAVTARARRRSWNERPVRLWLILAVVVALSTSYFAVRDLRGAMLERRLIRDGIKLSATIETIDQFEFPSRTFTREANHPVKLRYTTPAGKQVRTDVVLQATSPNDQIRVGDKIELRMDPNDPSIITVQMVPRSWTAALAVVILLAPLSLLLIAMTLWQRARVLRIWQTGEPGEAVVVDSHRSGIAPRSKVVRFTVEGSHDRRLFTTLYPHDAGDIHPGDALWIVMPKGKPGRALVAELYQ